MIFFWPPSLPVTTFIWKNLRKENFVPLHKRRMISTPFISQHKKCTHVHSHSLFLYFKTPQASKKWVIKIFRKNYALRDKTNKNDQTHFHYYFNFWRRKIKSVKFILKWQLTQWSLLPHYKSQEKKKGALLGRFNNCIFEFGSIREIRIGEKNKIKMQKKK